MCFINEKFDTFKLGEYAVWCYWIKDFKLIFVTVALGTGRRSKLFSLNDREKNALYILIGLNRIKHELVGGKWN